MTDISRRAFVLGVTSAGLTTGLRAGSRPTDAIEALLAARTIQVQTIDPAGDEFADLEPFAAAIGSAHVVQLGEPSHGAGSAFSAKARLVKFLHLRLGFDVLLWESGFYDVALAQAGMRSTDDAITAARRGIFLLWSSAAEIRPLFEYIKASQATLRPLEMAGFDMQVTADGVIERYAKDLRTFVAAPRDPVLRRRVTVLADQALDARKRLFASTFANASDLEALTEAARGLRVAISTSRSRFDDVRGALETSFMEHTIENMQADAVMRYEASRLPATTPERESRRDALNAKNLRWLLQEKYRGRKAIVWAHDVHVMNAYYASDFHDVHLDAHPGDMKTTGVFMATWLGKQVYTLGMTTFQGKDGFAIGGPTSQVPPAPAGSLEARLHTLGYQYALLDFRALEHGHPLRTRQIIRLPKYDALEIADVGRVYDGIFYIDQMAAATRLS